MLLGCAVDGAQPDGRRQGNGGATTGVPPSALSVLGNRSAPNHDLSGSSFCAATLIAPARVLTAAHCVGNRGLARVDAWAAADNLCSTRAVTTLRRHVRSAPATLDGDAIILRLSDRVPPRYAQPLEWGPRPQAGDEVTAWGWGAASPYGAQPCQAKATRLRVVPAADCADLDAAGGHVLYFCAIPAEGVNTCAGDSGGPVLDTAGRLVGVVSAGRGCGPSDPGIYWAALQ